MTRRATILEKLLLPDILQPVMIMARRPSFANVTSLGMKGVSMTVYTVQPFVIV